jgi:uncharacterized protein (TIGR03663 family)
VTVFPQAPTAAPRRAAGLSRRAELGFYAALTVLALVLRFWDLGDRPFHHDESQDAYFSWLLVDQGTYAYDPLLHGPLRFYLTGAVFLVFGDSDFTARLAPALMGVAMIPLCWLLRPLLGRLAAGVVAVILAIGPSYLYFGRFAREDIYIACITLALFAVVFRFLERPRPWQPAIVGALLAASFATKESTYITLFVVVTFFGAWLARDLRRGKPDLVRRLSAVGWEPMAWGVAVFVGVQTVLFTTFFTDPEHWDGLWEGLDYWLGQHEVGRGGEPWFFYLVLLFGVEWPVLALGALGTFAAIRRPTPFRLFCVWAFVVSLIVYSWAGEKFAWLVLHPLLPLIALAALGVQALWDARASIGARAGLAACGLAAAYLVFASFSVNARHRADPRELLVSTQSSEDVNRIRDRVRAEVRRIEAETGRSPTVTIDSSEGATFPWAWYFRDLPEVGFLDFSTVAQPPAGDILITTDTTRRRFAEALSGYRGQAFDFRVWWVRDYGEQSPATWARWFTQRETWNETGGMTAWMFLPRSV